MLFSKSIDRIIGWCGILFIIFIFVLLFSISVEDNYYRVNCKNAGGLIADTGKHLLCIDPDYIRELRVAPYYNYRNGS